MERGEKGSERVPAVVFRAAEEYTRLYFSDAISISKF